MCRWFDSALGHPVSRKPLIFADQGLFAQRNALDLSLEGVFTSATEGEFPAMLKHALLKNNAGLMLCGDYLTLEALHGVIHDVNEHSPVIVDKEGLFLGLAYDVRKAFEQQREVLKAPRHQPEIGLRFGVKILWPVLLVQARMLRVGLGFMDHSKQHQALTYALEHLIETALAEEFPEQSRALTAAWRGIDIQDPSLDRQLDSRGAVFCSWSKGQRRLGLLGLLLSLQPDYERAFAGLCAQGLKALVEPSVFETWENVEWPDPKW